MTKLGAVEFDDRILDALRDDKLVVFAGAGVSMGPPSNLASFCQLTSDIAQSTGLEPTEPLDRFLGQLHHRKVAVHERAAQLLSPTGSAPNTLHKELLRLFGTAERVRLVTTNFDLHFETAASELFGSTPEVYRAPALPRGYDFTGIVHVHGALPHARDLVLTDADFGRAYLTEGWGRRFLVDVFRQFTVLFVGYSHNDVVMHYLARALPADGVAGRFALTHEDGSWDLLGINPIRFTKGAGEDDAYKELYDGVQRLAGLASRRALDWQNRMAELGGRIPPADEDAISEVEQALREVHTTRFLTNVARDAEWPRWLNARKHLDALFDSGDLSERDKLLARWLAEHFAIAHADTVFELVAAHGVRLNPLLWQLIGCELGVNKGKPLKESALKRWATILLASAPNQADHHVLMCLAERCASHNAVSLTLKVFLTMSEHRLSIKLRSEADHARGQRLDVDCPLRADHWSLNEVWTKHIRPHLASVAEPLLSGIRRRLEDIHGELSAWGKASREWDPVSYGRAAIEPHDQNRYPEAVDVLIDAARDALEWLAINAPVLLDAWVEILVISDVPLLRRLAIHAITVHPCKSADDRLNWLLVRIGLHHLSEHHEVHRAVALSYKFAGDAARQAVVDAVLAHQLPESNDQTAEQRTASSHFNWLSWLLRAKPDCAAAEAALAPIRATYPDWRLSGHSDLLTHRCGPAGWVVPQSPWSIEQLLARTPREQLDDLLNFQGKRFNGPNRDGLIATIGDACKQRAPWALGLAEVLAERSLWTSDLWPAAIRGLQEAELPPDGWRALLAISAQTELLSAHAHDVANLLYALVRDGGKPFTLELLEQANVIALPLWQALQPDLQDDDIDDWQSRAINRPEGVLVAFWINGLSLLMRGKQGAEHALPDNYRQWFTMVMQDATVKGGLGCSLLASQTAFLFGLDETWTRQHLIPLFSEADRHKFAQAWDGFLVGGRLDPTLGEALMPAFLGALQRLSDLPERRRRFIEFYTALAVFHVADPTQKLLPELFQHASMEDRIVFATYLGFFLRHIQPATKKQMWDNWLHRYWQNRLQGVPAPLDEAEIREMLDWLPHLDEMFPVASSLAASAPTIQIVHSRLLFNLRNSDLVTRYPTETAELLIYLCNCDVGYSVAFLRAVAERLPALAPALQHRLDEALVRLG